MAAVTFHPSDGFAPWLHEQRVTLVTTTYDAGKLILIGSPDGQRIAMVERTIPRCMGLAAAPGALWVAARGRLLRFSETASSTAEARQYAPRITWYTGDIDAHDVAVDSDGPLIVATDYNAVVRPSANRSFEAAWCPPPFQRPRAGDRCHLNGLAVRDGAACAATRFADSAEPDGWRGQARTGGQILSVPEGRVLAGGLCMPHSPRWHDGSLWFLESGEGRLARLDDGGVHPVALLPGFARGLAMHDRYAVVGLSRLRPNAGLGQPPYVARLQRAGKEPMCGLCVVDTVTGAAEAGMSIGGDLIREVFDVAILRDTAMAQLVGFRGEDRFTMLDLEPRAVDP